MGHVTWQNQGLPGVDGLFVSLRVLVKSLWTFKRQVLRTKSGTYGELLRSKQARRVIFTRSWWL